jgi:hypothetical protein
MFLGLCLDLNQAGRTALFVAPVSNRNLRKRKLSSFFSSLTAIGSSGEDEHLATN